MPIPYPASGYVHFEAAADTMIDGQATRKIERTLYYHDWTSDQYGIEVKDPIFTHPSNDVVWIYVPAEAAFDTLYDMNAIPGDQWFLAAMPEPVHCQPESRMAVMDTGTMIISGMPLRWLAVDVHYIDDFGDEQVWQDTIVERIGSMGFYMLPHDLCNGFIDGAEGGGLLCYSDTEIEYISPWAENCVNSLSIEALGIREGFSVYPNPGSVQFNIHWNVSQHASVRIEIYSMLGGLIRSETASISPTTIDTHDLSVGCYSIRLIGKDVGTSVKWVKE